MKSNESTLASVGARWSVACWPTVPSVVLVQAWRGGLQAQLSRLLAPCAMEDLTEPRSRAA